MIMNIEKILFSILVANYNNGEFLQEAIDSVLDQTYHNWEMIIVDDGSTDGSQSIYEKYKDDNRFRFYFNDKNMGCGYTKRRCASYATGDLCAFLDPDDALMPNAIEIMVEQHNIHPECSLIYSTAYLYNGESKEGLTVWDYVGEIPSAYDSLLYRKKLVFHFAAYKNRCYHKTHGLNPKLKADVDRDLYCRLEEVGNLLFLPIPLYFYRVNNLRSISIGTDDAKNNAYQYSLVCQLDTICRRIGGTLYERNRLDYIKYMRTLMGFYYRSYLFKRINYSKYCFYYLTANHFNIHAFSHLCKIPKGR